MLPKQKTFFIILLLVILFSAAVLAFLQKGNLFSLPLISPNSLNSPNLPLRTLSPSEIKKMGTDLPSLRRTIVPLPVDNKDVAEKLKQADNVLLYTSDPNDTTGRTMLVDTNQKSRFL